MSNPILGSILAFGGNFAPTGWAFCAGQLMPISQNTALFSLLGTYYGGDGKSTFGLPDLRGRVAVNYGQGPGLSDYVIGEVTGNYITTLIPNNLPPHTHPVSVNITPGAADSANNASPVNAVYGSSGSKKLYNAAATVSMANYQAGLTMQTAGGSQPLSIQRPILAVTYIIALQGVFPARP